MNTRDFHHRLETMVRASDSSEYTITVHGRLRDDGRWEALLEFAPVSGTGRLVVTPVQTTQSSVRQIIHWSGGLSRAHFEDSLGTALHPVPRRPAAARAAATPATDEARASHLRPIERHVLEMFRAARATRLPAQQVFARGPHSNADFVRAFEELEKRWRYLVRHTTGGVDWLDLTVDGAAALGIPAAAGDDVPIEPPRPPR